MQDINVDNTKVTAKVENGKTIVEIVTEDADVFINGICVWSKYDHPLYAYIPPVFRSFVKDRNDQLHEKKDLVVADLWMKGSTDCATFYFPKNLQKAIVARIDHITDFGEIESDYIRNSDNINDETANTIVQELKDKHKLLLDFIASTGYKFYYSHSSENGYHGWWDVALNLEEWKEDTFLAIWKKISEYNERVKEIFDQYNL